MNPFQTHATNFDPSDDDATLFQVLQPRFWLLYLSVQIIGISGIFVFSGIFVTLFKSASIVSVVLSIMMFDGVVVKGIGLLIIYISLLYILL